MDLPIAAPQIPISDDFPHQILPFPDPSRLLYSNTLPPIPPQDTISDRPIPPPQPQKLRPIRSGGRSPAASHPENRGLAKLREVGPLLAGREGRSEYFDSLVKVTATDLTENYVLSDGVTNGYLPANDRKNVDAVAESSIPNCGGFTLEEELSSSSGCSGGDSVADMKYSVDRKRKKRRKQKMEHFLEKMVMKVMERQEQMHRQLIEVIEKKEADKQAREEAWKQREIERTTKDEKLRAQQTSRSLHLISLIENISGREIPIPQTIRRQYMEEDGGDSGIQKEIKGDASNKRWSESEVESLIALRSQPEHKFHTTGSKRPKWEDISDEMLKREKWENINKY